MNTVPSEAILLAARVIEHLPLACPHSSDDVVGLAKADVSKNNAGLVQPLPRRDRSASVPKLDEVCNLPCVNAEALAQLRRESSLLPHPGSLFSLFIHSTRWPLLLGAAPNSPSTRLLKLQDCQECWGCERVQVMLACQKCSACMHAFQWKKKTVRVRFWGRAYHI